MSTLVAEAKLRQSLPPPRPKFGRRLAAGAVAIWLLTGVYIVPADQQAVVTRFGAIVEPRAMPGIHLTLPWPIDRVTRLKVRQLQRLVVGGDPADLVLGRTQPALSQFLSGDQNVIQVRAVVQYSVEIPAQYLFRAQDVARMIGSAVEAEAARRIAHRGVDAVLTTEKAAIQEEVRAAAQRRLSDYGAGVAISTVNLETIAPPAEAADAFRDVASARADAERISNEAFGYANDLIPKARGEAQQTIEAALAYKERKTNEAAGDAARFEQLAREAGRAGPLTARRLYIEAMEEVLPRIQKLYVDKNGNLDLTLIRKGEEPAARTRK